MSGKTEGGNGRGRVSISPSEHEQRPQIIPIVIAISQSTLNPGRVLPYGNVQIDASKLQPHSKFLVQQTTVVDQSRIGVSFNEIGIPVYVGTGNGKDISQGEVSFAQKEHAIGNETSVSFSPKIKLTGKEKK